MLGRRRKQLEIDASQIQSRLAKMGACPAIVACRSLLVAAFLSSTRATLVTRGRGAAMSSIPANASLVASERVLASWPPVPTFIVGLPERFDRLARFVEDWRTVDGLAFHLVDAIKHFPLSSGGGGEYGNGCTASQLVLLMLLLFNTTSPVGRYAPSLTNVSLGIEKSWREWEGHDVVLILEDDAVPVPPTSSAAISISSTLQYARSRLGDWDLINFGASVAFDKFNPGLRPGPGDTTRYAVPVGSVHLGAQLLQVDVSSTTHGYLVNLRSERLRQAVHDIARLSLHHSRFVNEGVVDTWLWRLPYLIKLVDVRVPLVQAPGVSDLSETHADYLPAFDGVRRDLTAVHRLLINTQEEQKNNNSSNNETRPVYVCSLPIPGREELPCHVEWEPIHSNSSCISSDGGPRFVSSSAVAPRPLRWHLLSDLFAGELSSTRGKVARSIHWDFDNPAFPLSDATNESAGGSNGDISVGVTANTRVLAYVDGGGYYRGLADHASERQTGPAIHATVRVLWLLDSRQFSAGGADLVCANLATATSVFTQIWTHDRSLTRLHPSMMWSPATGTLIKDKRVYPKSRLVSMITSDKVVTPQQRYRVSYAAAHRHELDLFGYGFRPLIRKEDGLRDYMFSIAIENDSYDDYFTEKILDCFATGTIPVYKGTRAIGKYFNADGIIFLDELQSLSDLTPQLYASKLRAVHDNFLRVLHYDTIEDWIVPRLLQACHRDRSGPLCGALAERFTDTGDDSTVAPRSGSDPSRAASFQSAGALSVAAVDRPRLCLLINHGVSGVFDVSHCCMSQWRMELQRWDNSGDVSASGNSGGAGGGSIGDVDPETAVTLHVDIHILRLADDVKPWSDPAELVSLREAAVWAEGALTSPSLRASVVDVPPHFRRFFHGSLIQLGTQPITRSSQQTTLRRCNTTLPAQLRPPACNSSIMVTKWRIDSMPSEATAKSSSAVLIAAATSSEVLWSLHGRSTDVAASSEADLSVGDSVLFDAAQNYPTAEGQAALDRCTSDDGELSAVRAFVIEALPLPLAPPLQHLLAAHHAVGGEGKPSSDSRGNRSIRPSRRQRRAFVTLLFGSSYLPGVIGLAASLARLGIADTAPLVVMIPCAGLGDGNVLAYEGGSVVTNVSSVTATADDSASGVRAIYLPAALSCVPSLSSEQMDLLVAAGAATLTSSSSDNSSANSASQQQRPPRILVRLVPQLDLPPGIDIYAPYGGVWDMLQAWGLWSEWDCLVQVNADNIVINSGLLQLFDTGICRGGVTSHSYSTFSVDPSTDSVAAAAISPKPHQMHPLTATADADWPLRLMVGLPMINMRQYAARDPSNALIVLRPDAATYGRLIATARASRWYKHAEMGFLSAAFWGHRLLLPHTTLCTPNALGSGVYANLNLDDCYSLDFVGCGSIKYKPWDAADPSDPKFGCRDYDVSSGYRQAIQLWKSIYRQALATMPEGLRRRLPAV